MAFRLGELVVCGEIFNTKKNSVHGWLGLRGIDRPVKLELTGDCDPDLAGRHFRFEAPPPVGNQQEDSPGESEEQTIERLNLKGFAWLQIGTTGTMTADHQVKHADCSVEELCMRLRLKEPPPMRWVRCLYLEWYSQNGRVVIELPDPVIEFIGQDGQPEPDDWKLPEDLPPANAPPEPGGGPSITAFRMNEDGEIEITDETPCLDEDETEDEFKLIPDELQRQLDAQSREVDKALSSGDEQDSITRDLEAMDEALEKGERVPLGSLFDETIKLPKPDRLTEHEAEVELKGLLTRLAMFGVALHICEHFTALDAYRLLVEGLCKEDVAFAEICKTGWVQHFDTAEYCEACQAEFDRKFEEEQRQRQEDADDMNADDDMPF